MQPWPGGSSCVRRDRLLATIDALSWQPYSLLRASPSSCDIELCVPSSHAMIAQLGEHSSTMNSGSIGFVGFGPPGLFGPVGRYASVEQHPLGRHFTNLMNHMNFRFHRSQPFSFDPMEIDEMFPFTAAAQPSRRRSGSRSENGTNSVRPLASDEIKKIKTTKITAEQVAQRKECYTCMEEFKQDERALRIGCPHLFHRKCLEPWLKRQNTCPVCRASVNP
uniref:RING-type domain-containing protein n=1 Tax=Steinernema glaseri TaxID=37863 RepID=A0A1I7ZRZ2_9BILA